MVELFPRTIRLVTVWAARTPSRHFLTLLRHSIFLMEHRYLSTVSLLLEDSLGHRHFPHSHLSPPHKYDRIGMGYTTARWWFWNRARYNSISVVDWLHFDPCLHCSDNESSVSEADSKNVFTDTEQPPVSSLDHCIPQLKICLPTKRISTGCFNMFDDEFDSCSPCLARRGID